MTTRPFASGDNTFQVPTGATAVLICPPLALAASVKVRTNLNITDAGLPIGPYPGAGLPFAVFPLPSGVTSVILNSNTTVAGFELSFI